MRHALKPFVPFVLAVVAVVAAVAAQAAPGAAAPPATPLPMTMPEAVAPPAGHASMPGAKRKRPQPVEHYVDINGASRKELMTLPGIGKAEADRIIAHRPYLTKTELVSKGVLPTGPYLSLKRYVVALPKSQAAKQKPPKVAAATPGEPQRSAPKAP